MEKPKINKKRPGFKNNNKQKKFQAAALLRDRDGDRGRLLARGQVPDEGPRRHVQDAAHALHQLPPVRPLLHRRSYTPHGQFEAQTSLRPIKFYLQSAVLKL